MSVYLRQSLTFKYFLFHCLHFAFDLHLTRVEMPMDLFYEQYGRVNPANQKLDSSKTITAVRFSHVLLVPGWEGLPSYCL